MSIKLSKSSEAFILHWGEMGSNWGVNRSVAQIHALLYLTEKPLCAEEIVNTLGITRSNVSTSLRELQNWQLIKVVNILGDRRDHFSTSKDIWQLFKLIVQGRKQRELAPTLAFLQQLTQSAEFNDEAPNIQQAIQQNEQFLAILLTWIDEMLRQEPKTLMKIFKVGSKVSNLLRKK